MQALASAADLTTGAFYSQFGGKPELLAAIIDHELGRTLGWFDDASPASLKQALSRYLSDWHVAHPAQGCAIPSLAAEVGRADVATREVFEARMVALQQAMARGLGDDAAAWALLCQAAGGVLVARAFADPARAADVLASVRRQALLAVDALTAAAPDAGNEPAP